MPRAVEEHGDASVARGALFDVVSLAALVVLAVHRDAPHAAVRDGHEHLHRLPERLREHENLRLAPPRARAAHVVAVRVEVALDEPLDVRASPGELVHRESAQAVRLERLRGGVRARAVVAERARGGDGAEETPAVPRDRVHVERPRGGGWRGGGGGLDAARRRARRARAETRGRRERADGRRAARPARGRGVSGGGETPHARRAGEHARGRGRHRASGCDGGQPAAPGQQGD